MNKCIMCAEPDAPVHPYLWPRGQHAHAECMLRQVTGGIGHLIAHDYWCNQRHDPDAGLTYHQSALLVERYVEVVGTEPAG